MGGSENDLENHCNVVMMSRVVSCHESSALHSLGGGCRQAANCALAFTRRLRERSTAQAFAHYRDNAV